jgi:hypothetical protein
MSESNLPDVADQRKALEGSNSLADLAARIRAEHEEALRHVERGLVHALRAGELLIEAKTQLAHGQWLPWLRKHCRVGARTAQVYMQLVRLVPNAQRVADLPLRTAVKHLHKLDRRAQLLAYRERCAAEGDPRWHRWEIMSTALSAVRDQLYQHEERLRAEPPCGWPECGCDCLHSSCSRYPTHVALDAVDAQLDALEEAKAKRAQAKAERAQAADKLVERLLADAHDAGLSRADLIEALCRRGLVVGGANGSPEWLAELFPGLHESEQMPDQAPEFREAAE